MQAVFFPGEEREAYLSGEPADDDRFIGVFAHELEHSGGYTPEPVRYPHNGRTLTDDVVDVFLSMYTNGKVTRDKVGPHSDLLDGFPYLGPPHGFTPKGIKENL
jgi:hypothetical protein